MKPKSQLQAKACLPACLPAASVGCCQAIGIRLPVVEGHSFLEDLSHAQTIFFWIKCIEIKSELA